MRVEDLARNVNPPAPVIQELWQRAGSVEAPWILRINIKKFLVLAPELIRSEWRPVHHVSGVFDCLKSIRLTTDEETETKWRINDPSRRGRRQRLESDDS